MPALSRHAQSSYDDRMNPADKNADPIRLPERRSFLTRAATVVMGGIVFIFPFAAGLGVFFDPLRRRKSKDAGNVAEEFPFIRICPLDALPADGTPQLFPVITDVADAWTDTPGQRIGSVFLTRTDAEGKPTISLFYHDLSAPGLRGRLARRATTTTNAPAMSAPSPRTAKNCSAPPSAVSIRST